MSRSYTIIAGSGYRKEDPYRLFLERLEEMRAIAREATKRSYSYRDVKVGCAVLSIVEDTPIWGITDGYNLKKSGKEKNCSEKKALHKAYKGGFNKGIGMVVVSSTTKEENEGIVGYRTPTLLPCEVCHGDFRGDPIAREEMLVVTAGLDKDIIQVNTVGRLARILAEEEPGLLVYDRVMSDVDFSRLVPAYDVLEQQQKFVPNEKRLTHSEMAILSILSQKA